MLNWFECWAGRLLALFIFFFSQTAMAQTGDWQVQEGGRIRISFDASPRYGAGEDAYGLIEVKLAPHWKTYWKDPGTSGMAPELDVRYVDVDGGETKLAAELLFPEPVRIDEDEGNGWIYGYQHGVNLPFRLNLPAKTGTIVGLLLIGLCYDVCLPLSVDFAFDVDSAADFLTKGRIEAALAMLPQAVE